MNSEDEQFDRLLDFVVQSLEKGHSEDEIRALLLKRNLNPDYIDELFAYADLAETTDNNQPTKSEKPSTSAATPKPPIQSDTTPMTNHPSSSKMFGGRIGRIQYFLGILYLYGLLALPTIIIVIIRLAFPDFYLNNLGLQGLIVLVFIVLGFYAFLGVINISLFIRRLHDMNKPGIWVLVALLPVLANFLSVYLIFTNQLNELQFASLISLMGMAFALYLLFAPGTKGPNKFGEPSPSHNFWVILGLKKLK